MGFLSVCVGSVILFKQLAFAFVISVLTVQSDLPHVYRSFVNSILETLRKFSRTVAQAPSILTFILLTLQTCEMGMDKFHGKVALKYAIAGTIIYLLPLIKCFTTKGLTPVAASPSLVSDSEQTHFPRALFTRAIWWAHTMKPKNPIDNMIVVGKRNISFPLPNTDLYMQLSPHTAL